MNEILEEALDEAVGGSSKRWALLLIVFVAGGVTACGSSAAGAVCLGPTVSDRSRPAADRCRLIPPTGRFLRSHDTHAHKYTSETP